MANPYDRFIGPLTQLDTELERYLELIPGPHELQRRPDQVTRGGKKLPLSNKEQPSNPTAANAGSTFQPGQPADKSDGNGNKRRHRRKKQTNSKEKHLGNGKGTNSITQTSNTAPSNPTKIPGDSNNGNASQAATVPQPFSNSKRSGRKRGYRGKKKSSNKETNCGNENKTSSTKSDKNVPKSDPKLMLGGNKASLLSLPTELLYMILEPLLVCPGNSLPLDTFDDLPPRKFRTQVSAAILRTCKKLYAEGRSLLYGGNVFYIQPTPCYGGIQVTPLTNASVAKITHIEVLTEPLYTYDRIPPPPRHDSLHLGWAIHKYPFGMLQHVQSIHCILDTDELSRNLAVDRLGISKDWDDAQKEWHHAGHKDGPEKDAVTRLSITITDTLVKWNALLIAEAVKQHCPGAFTRMYCASRFPLKEAPIGQTFIVLYRDTPRLGSMIAFSKHQGLEFKAELQVDLEKRIVKEITGSRPGHFY